MSDHEVWNVLVIDDEEDVHAVTAVALKGRRWRQRPLKLSNAYSAASALQLLSDGTRYQVALVDVVMETDTAGLELCRFIRQHQPSSLRIILRTGHGGVAPQEQVFDDYDIDYYLAKPDLTADCLYAAIRACLRSSQDIETLLAFSRQLQSFTSALQTVASADDLLMFMKEGLKFLELKHATRIHFSHEVPAGSPPSAGGLEEAVGRAFQKGYPCSVLGPADDLELPGGHVLPFAIELEGSTVRGGFLVERQGIGRLSDSLEADLILFMENWRLAYGALLRQQRADRDKLLREQMYAERMQSVATMVTGIAHEINTPLGVAMTANSVVGTLVNELSATAASGAPTDSLVADVRDASALLGKNLERASRLVRGFKQLSASQMADDRATLDLTTVVRDCIETMRPETRKRKLEVRFDAPGVPLQWTGYPGHLSQVIINMFQNAMRYAYGDEGGPLDLRIRIETDDGADAYRIEIEDYGAGVDPAVLPRIFQPYVTTGREKGGTGLGLAICHNIMTKLLKGTIDCRSTRGKGTRFDLVMPRHLPLPADGTSP